MHSISGSEKFPAMFTLNISYNGVRLERRAHTLNWDYSIDADLSHTASVCDISKEEDGIWYKTVMPLSGEVEKCEYIPKKGFEDYVKVKSIKVNN